MINSFIIAQEYAKAIFNIALEQKNENQWKSTLKLLSKISQNNLIRSLCYKFLDPKKLAEIFITIYKDMQGEQINTFIYNVIYIMAKNNRILLLPIVFKKFNDLYYQHKQSIKIEVISARTLNNNQLQKITDIMSHRLSKTVHIERKIDQDIIAGIVIRIKDTVIDGSVKGRILRLRNILQS